LAREIMFSAETLSRRLDDDPEDRGRVAAGRFETRVSPSPAEPELRSEERRLQNNSAPPPAR
ncbi:unnamed protein product, partial [Effrenium voratum]